MNIGFFGVNVFFYSSFYIIYIKYKQKVYILDPLSHTHTTWEVSKMKITKNTLKEIVKGLRAVDINWALQDFVSELNAKERQILLHILALYIK